MVFINKQTSKLGGPPCSGSYQLVQWLGPMGIVLSHHAHLLYVIQFEYQLINQHNGMGWGYGFHCWTHVVAEMQGRWRKSPRQWPVPNPVRGFSPPPSTTVPWPQKVWPISPSPINIKGPFSCVPMTDYWVYWWENGKKLPKTKMDDSLQWLVNKWTHKFPERLIVEPTIKK